MRNKDKIFFFIFALEYLSFLNFQNLGDNKNVETVKKSHTKILAKIYTLLYNGACAKEKGGVRNFGKVS